MRVIVDTSVWSLALRRKSYHPSLAVEKLTRLLEEGESLFLLGVILQELLQGLRLRKDFDRLHKRLEPFPLIEPRRKDYVEAARLRNHCESRGVQAGTIDVLIATISIQHDCLLLTTDADFRAIARHSALKLI